MINFLTSLTRKFFAPTSPTSLSITGKVDAWGAVKEPGTLDLIQLLTDTTYACLKLNANGVAKAKFRIYVHQNSAGRKCRFKTKSLQVAQRRAIAGRKTITNIRDVEELLDHPAIDLLNNPNPYHSNKEFVSYIAWYLQATGTAYAFKSRDTDGAVNSLWVVPTQFVRPVLENQYCTGYTIAQSGEIPGLEPNKPISLEDMIVFSLPNLDSPYANAGVGYVRRCYESLLTLRRMKATENAVLTNNARPDMIVSFPNGTSPNELSKFEKYFLGRYSRSGSQLPLFTQDDVKVSTLSYSPKDLSYLQIEDQVRYNICRVTGVPIAMLDKDLNYATLSSSRLQHIEDGVKPLLAQIESKLQKHLIEEEMEGSGRIFIMYDDPSPESSENIVSEVVALANAGITTINECREQVDLPMLPPEIGDRLGGPYNQANQPGTAGALDGVASDAIDPTAQAPAPVAPVADGPAPDAAAAVDPAAVGAPKLGLNGAQIQGLNDVVAAFHQGMYSPANVVVLVMGIMQCDQATAEKWVADLPQKPMPTEAPAPEAPVAPVAEAPAPVKRFKAINNQGWKEPPYSEELKTLLSQYFEKQRTVALTSLKKIDPSKIKAFQPYEAFSKDLAKKAQPLIQMMFNQGGEEVQADLGIDDYWNVTNPDVQREIQKLALQFVEETNNTTKMQINDALQSLRDSFEEGMAQGERLSQLTDRVNEIFDGLSSDHAETIARTESVRAYNQGIKTSAKESGVAKGFELLLSPGACEDCQAIYAQNKQIGLDGSFGTRPDAPPAYQDLTSPPLHPKCRCALLTLIDD